MSSGSESSSSTDASTRALLSSVPPPAGPALPNLTEFRSNVATIHSESDHEDTDSGSGSSWSCGGASGIVPERHVRGSRASQPRPPMPNWSPPSSTDAAKPRGDSSPSATAATPAASAFSTDSTESTSGPTSQSPIRRKRQSAGRRSRPNEVRVSVHELSLSSATGQATVEVSPRCVEFGSTVQWCRQACTVSVHNPSRFTAQLHGGIISDDTGPGPFVLQLDNGWPSLPPMSTVALQVEFAPSALGPYAATLVVHATTEGAGSAPVAAACDLRGRCVVSPLQLALEHGNEDTVTSGCPSLRSLLRLRLQNTSVQPTDLFITAEQPFETQTTSVRLPPGEVYVAIIRRYPLRNDQVPLHHSWLTVHDQTNANTHRLDLFGVLNAAAPTTTATPANVVTHGHNVVLKETSSLPTLADSISAWAAGGPTWCGLVGVCIQVQVEIYNAHSQPVHLVPRLEQCGDEATHDRSTIISLERTEPVVASPSTPSTYVASIFITQAGTHAVQLHLLCTDESSVVVPITLQAEEESWIVDDEADGLDFGTVDGHGIHYVSTQIHNRSTLSTFVRIFLDEEIETSGRTKCQWFFAKIGCPREDVRDENVLRLVSGDRIQLPACSDDSGSVTVHIGLQPVGEISYDSLIECRGSLRVQSLRRDGEPKTVSVSLRAQMGTPRLQVPGGEQLLLFCIESPVAKTCTQHLSLRNYGNVVADCNLNTTSKYFCVNPQAVVIGPSEVVKVTITFTVEVASTDTGLEQLPDTITGHLDVNTKHTLFQIPLRAEIRTHPHLVCNAPVVNWGCVDVGATQRQSIVVRNRSNFSCEIFAAIADLDGPDQARPSPFIIEGPEIVQLHGNSGHEFVLTFAPIDVSVVRHGLFIRDKYGRTYKIPLLGAGGKSHFTLDLEAAERAIGFSLHTQNTSARRTLTVRNTGTRTGFVHIDCTSMAGDIVVIGPRNAVSVVVAPNKSHDFVLEVSSQTSTNCSSPIRQEVALDIYCGDELARRRRRQCRHARWSEELGFSGSSLSRDVFDDTFSNEQFFVEPHRGEFVSTHEDTMFDDYFDEAIFEAQLHRLSVPVIVGSSRETAPTPNPSSAAAAEANLCSTSSSDKATRQDNDEHRDSRMPLGERKVDNTGERSKARGTAKKSAATPRHPECLHTLQTGLEFPPTFVGETTSSQLELCNGHKREVTVAVSVQLPFEVRHQRFRIRSRSRVRLPVNFNPVANGPVRQVVQIETTVSAHKETLELPLYGIGK